MITLKSFIGKIITKYNVIQYIRRSEENQKKIITYI